MSRVVVLTEEKDFFENVRRQLSASNNIEVRLFSKSLDLINYFLLNYAQLVILDVDLLNEDSLKLIEVLRSIHRDAKIVLILSHEKMPICSSALSLGVVSYQIKPVGIDTTSELMRSILSMEHHQE